MKTIARLGLLSLLAACGGSQGEDAAAHEEPTQAQEPTPNYLNKPVSHPMIMRETINLELNEQKTKARAREELFERATRGNQ